MKTYTAKQIAEFFLALSCPEAGDNISNLKLQKLCYYAQAIIAVVRVEPSKPLFSESIEAWQHGPVVPDLYHEYKDYGNEGISCDDLDFNIDDIEARDQAVLTDVFNHFGQFSAWKLRDMTHEESPWLDAVRTPSKRITIEALMECFSEDLDHDYVQRYQCNEKH